MYRSISYLSVILGDSYQHGFNPTLDLIRAVGVYGGTGWSTADPRAPGRGHGKKPTSNVSSNAIPDTIESIFLNIVALSTTDDPAGEI